MVGHILVRSIRKVEAIDESTGISQDPIASSAPITDTPAKPANNQSVEALLPAVEDVKADAVLLGQTNTHAESLEDSTQVIPQSGMLDAYSASPGLKTKAVSVRAPLFNPPKTSATKPSAPTPTGAQKSANDST